MSNMQILLNGVLVGMLITVLAGVKAIDEKLGKIIGRMDRMEMAMPRASGGGTATETRKGGGL